MMLKYLNKKCPGSGAFFIYTTFNQAVNLIKSLTFAAPYKTTGLFYVIQY